MAKGAALAVDSEDIRAGREQNTDTICRVIGVPDAAAIVLTELQAIVS